MKGATFQHSTLFLLIVTPLLGEKNQSHSSSMICADDSSMIVGLSLDPLWGSVYASKEGDSSTREGNCRDALIGVGDNSAIVGFCLAPDRACWIRATA